MMAKPHRLLGSALIILGLFLNPLGLAALFAQDGTLESTSFIAIILFIEFLLINVGVMVYRKPEPWLVKTGLVIVSSLLFLLFTVFIDRMYGHYLKPDTANLAFPAYSSAKYSSSEYTVTVRINNLGFRGPDTSIAKKKKRVVLIGDSFTFGWGVEEEETWIALLAEKYPEVEFLNLGRGGKHPGDYVQTAQKVVPLLKPDLVIVGILQANDIKQLMQLVVFERGDPVAPVQSEQQETPQQVVHRLLLNLYPNLSERFPRTVDIRNRWLADSRAVLESLNQAQLARYNLLPEAITSAHEAGLLNPSLIYGGMHDPDYFCESVDTTNELCRAAIIRLHDHLWELHQIAAESNAELIVLNMPIRPFGFSNELTALEELGFRVAGCDTLDAELPLRMATAHLGLAVLYPALAPDTGLFYTYDGHWNRDGNRKFAVELINHLDTLETWKHLLTSSTF